MAGREAKNNPTLKRNPTQRARDLAITANLYMQGYTLKEIATYLNTSEEEDRDYEICFQQVHYDLKKLRESWLQSALVDMDQRKAEELAKIDRLEREYWEAWQRSLDTEVTVRTETDVNGERVVRSSKESVGDPRYLQGIQWCINRRVEIFGLDAPKRTEQETRATTVHAVLDLSKVNDRELHQLEALLSKALPGPSEGGKGPAQSDRVHDADVLDVPARTVS
jgi:hypothetical protein